MSLVVNETQTSLYPSFTVCAPFRNGVTNLVKEISREAKEKEAKNIEEIDFDGIINKAR